MKFSYNWLQSFFKQKLPSPEKLAEILSLHSFEVEKIEKVGKDFSISIDVLPNRTDCYSHLGIAREISALLGLKMSFDWKRPREGKEKIENWVEVKVKEGCNRYTGRLIFEPEIKDSPDWLKMRLESCGIKPINNVVDITNYVMLEIGQPLHAFDLEKIEKRKIIVRRAKSGEKILTLDDEEYELNNEILVIADEKKPIAIAGIKGGKETGISKETKLIFLESANFEREIIGRGWRSLDLKTDASLRFEHGLDPNLTEKGVDLAASLIQEIAGGKVAKGKIDVFFKKPAPILLKLDPEKTNSLLGIEISPKEQVKILKKLEFKAKLEKGKISVLVPSFRLDVKIEEDLVEEIGRVYGLEKIEPKFPKISLQPPEKNLEIFWEEFVKNELKGMGFSEVLNYNFLSLALAEKCGFKKEELIEIKNPVSFDFQYLRPSLIPYLLRVVKKNLIDFKEIKIFEIGKVFKKEGEKNLEKKMLGGATFGGGFFQLKGEIESLISRMGITDFWFDSFKPKISPLLWHPKKSVELKIGEETIGVLGTISKNVLVEMEIEGEVYAFEIDFEKLARLASEEVEFRPISPYPAVLRDISVSVPHQTFVEEVLEVIERKGGRLIEDVDLIDIFEEEERKTLTFRIVFRAQDRALSSKEVEILMNKIFEGIREYPNWEIKK